MVLSILKILENFIFQHIIDRDKILSNYSRIAHKAIGKGKRGLRTFVDMKIFFERKYVNYVTEFEKSLSPFSALPIIVICAYDLDDFEMLDIQSKKILFDHHSLHLSDNSSRSIFDQSIPVGGSEHICMLYDDDQFQNSSLYIDPIISNSILRYLSEGLQQDHLCIYLSMNNLEKSHSEILVSQLSNLEDSPSINDNLIIVLNSDDFYINSSCENLKTFED